MYVLTDYMYTIIYYTIHHWCSGWNWAADQLLMGIQFNTYLIVKCLNPCHLLHRASYIKAFGQGPLEFIMRPPEGTTGAPLPP